MLFRLDVSRLPQGMALGPLLLVIHINDLDVNVAAIIRKFEDNTKIGGEVAIEDVCLCVQQGIDQMESWAEHCEIKLDPKKCNIMYIGKANTERIYTLNCRAWIHFFEQQNHGVKISSSLKLVTG